jgi:hypothetical protein
MIVACFLAACIGFIKKQPTINLTENIPDSFWIYETKWAINVYFKILVSPGRIGAA